jgi:hypothetical protein
MPAVVYGVVRLICALIDWRAKIDYERAHAASVAEILRAVPAGGTLTDERADGAVLRIDIPAHREPRGRSARETTGGSPC